MSTNENQLVPYGLTCEQRTEPLAVDEPAPRLSWKLRSSVRDDRQSAYRVTVTARSSDGEQVWDSGRIASTDTLHIPYEGRAFTPTTRYHWRVEVWDAQGERSGEAESWFETGLLGSGWSAEWIGRDPNAKRQADPPELGTLPIIRDHRLPPCPYLRRGFELSEQPVRARLYCSARGLYRAFLNGTRVNDDELAPGWTEYDFRIPYEGYDVTASVRAGENVLGALLGEGWWSGFYGMDPRRAGKHYGESPSFIGQLLLEYADGRQEWIRTDDQWLESPGPLRWSDLLMGDGYDSRVRLGDWSEPGYDASDWRPVAVVEGDTSLLYSNGRQPVRVVQELPAIASWQGPDGTTIVDLGQNMVGRVRLTVRNAEAGQRIRLKHAEILSPDGRLYLENLRSVQAKDVYVTSGEPVETYEPTFTFHGFRYVEVIGYPGELNPGDVVGHVLSSDVPWIGRFDCDDEIVNKLCDNIRWGQLGNFVSIPTDCPQRDERLGWMGDAQVFVWTAARGADVSAFFSDWMIDVVYGQDGDGAFPDVSPKLCVLSEGAPAWGDAGVIIPWALYRLYGDRRALQRCFPAMAAWVDHVHRHNPNLIWENRTGNNYGDWLQVDASTPREVLATAFFAGSAKLVAESARVLGDESAAARYDELHKGIRQSFIDCFVQPDGKIYGETQTCYLVALDFELLPADLVPKAVEWLAADVESRDNHLTTGFVGVARLCPVLTKHGRADLAHALLHQDTYPSWLFSVHQGATTIWERWDGWTPDKGFQSPAMNSFNHYSLGAVGDWLYGDVAGIGQTPESVAYSELLIRPYPGRMGTAGAVQETARGRVESRWTLADGRLGLDVEVPPGATAQVVVPTDDPDAVTENGKPVPATHTVGSGRYHFDAPYSGK